MANETNAIKKTSSTIGVDKYTFWELTEDALTGAVYGPAYQFPGTISVTLTDSSGTSVIDADNGAYEALSYTEKIGHDLENVDIPPEVDALWRGVEPDEFGGVAYDKNTKQKYFAAAFRLEKAGGWHRYFRCYKGIYSFAPSANGKTKPSSGAPEAQTAKASYAALNRDYDDKVMYILDDRDMTDEQRAEIAVKWFEDPDWFPTKATTPTTPAGE